LFWPAFTAAERENLALYHQFSLISSEVEHSEAADGRTYLVFPAFFAPLEHIEAIILVKILQTNSARSANTLGITHRGMSHHGLGRSTPLTGFLWEVPYFNFKYHIKVVM